MWEFIENRMVRAAKEYRCEACSGVIAKGDRHQYSAGKCEGEFIDYRMCLACKRLADAWCREIDEEGFPLGDMRRMLVEYEGVADVDAWLEASEARHAAAVTERAEKKARTEARMAAMAGVICDRCAATLATYGEACTAALDDACPGFLAIERARRE